MTTVRQNITHFVLNSLILLAIPPTTRTRSACSAGWREDDARGRGHPEEEEAAEISSENHPQRAKN